jgi:hypothetical protein
VTFLGINNIILYIRLNFTRISVKDISFPSAAFPDTQEEPSVSIPLACCDKRDVASDTVKVEIRRSDSMTMDLIHSKGIATYARLYCLAVHQLLYKANGN